MSIHNTIQYKFPLKNLRICILTGGADDVQKERGGVRFLLNGCHSKNFISPFSHVCVYFYFKTKTSVPKKYKKRKKCNEYSKVITTRHDELLGMNYQNRQCPKED